jgi:hypothetical protein
MVFSIVPPQTQYMSLTAPREQMLTTLAALWQCGDGYAVYAGRSEEFYPRTLFFGIDIGFSGFQSSEMDTNHQANKCPKCGSLMRLALAPGGKGPRSLRCECECPDPLAAGAIGGWLKGELRPPK